MGEYLSLLKWRRSKIRRHKWKMDVEKQYVEMVFHAFLNEELTLRQFTKLLHGTVVTGENFAYIINSIIDLRNRTELLETRIQKVLSGIVECCRA
jgi:hypothetical protein